MSRLRKNRLRYALLVLASVVGGCAGNGDFGNSPAPGGGGGNQTAGSPVFRDGDRVVSTQSDLVLQLPADLPATVADQTLIGVYEEVLAEPACRSSAQKTIDFLLAQTCELYHRFYLYSQNLPASLDGVPTPADFVAGLRQEDPFTSYIASARFQEVVIPTLEGARATIGFRFRIEGSADVVGPDAPLTVTGVIPFTRAWFDGLQAGDQIVEIDGQPVAGLTLRQVQALFPTGEAQAVVFTVSRNGAAQTVRTASEVHISFLVRDDIAYLNVRSFTDVTGDRVREDFDALVQAAAKPLDKVILDLRGDGGGSVQGALSLADYLIDRDTPPKTNPILTFDGTILHDVKRYLGDYGTVNLPGRTPANTVVLMDGGTASASEIVVAALKDYGVAETIGALTFGKGVRQDVFPLVDGAGVVITSHSILPPNGVSYHRIGIQPDIAVQAASSPTQDPGLDAAIAWLETGTVPVSDLVAAGRVPAGPARRTWDLDVPLAAVRHASAFPFQER